MQQAFNYSLCVKPRDHVLRFDGKVFNREAALRGNGDLEKEQKEYCRGQQILSGSGSNFSIADAIETAMTDNEKSNGRSFERLCLFMMNALFQEETLGMDGTMGQVRGSFNKREDALAYTAIFHLEPKPLAASFKIMIDDKDYHFDHTAMEHGFIELIDDDKHFVRIYPCGRQDGLDGFIVVAGRYSDGMIPYSNVEMCVGDSTLFAGHVFGLTLPGVQSRMITEIKQLLSSVPDFFSQERNTTCLH